MTGTEWLAYVKRKFKRTDKDTEIYESTTDTIQDMRMQFLDSDSEEQASVQGISTVGEYRLAIPSDMGHFIGSISITDTSDDSYYSPLAKISKQSYDEKYPDRNLTSASNMHTDVPREFCIYGDQIWLGPVPDKTDYKYFINYTTESTAAIDGNTADVPFSGTYRNYLRAGTLMDLHDGMENYEEAGYWERKYMEGVAKIAGNEKYDKADDEPIYYNGV